MCVCIQIMFEMFWWTPSSPDKLSTAALLGIAVVVMVFYPMNMGKLPQEGMKRFPVPKLYRHILKVLS